MQDQLLENYLKLLLSMRVDSNKHLGVAPHKPILLLAIMEGIRKKEINSNRIEITPELIFDFKSIWNSLSITKRQSNFSLPFYHMKSSPFWRLVLFAGKKLSVSSSKSIKSFKRLKAEVAYAELDKNLFQLMEDKIMRKILSDSICQKYLGISHLPLKVIENHQLSLASEFELEKNIYQNRMSEITSTYSENELEEERYIRSGAFRKKIIQIYHSQCAISQLSTNGIELNPLLDACHIIPFSNSNDDTITNGIALCPNLHRAFDRGLITINDQFKVRISPVIKKESTAYNLHQFEGKEICLPDNTKWYPSIENLVWHNKECFRL